MKRVHVIGDSISIHYGPYLERYLRGFLAYSRKEGIDEAKLNLDSPQGANGGDSSMVLNFLRARAAAGGIAADILLLNCGLHDIKTDPSTGKKQIPLSQYGENLRQIIAVARAMGLKLVWVRTTPCDEKVHNKPTMQFHRFAADCQAYNSAADEIMQTHGCPVIDLHLFTLNLEGEIYCDHVHFLETVRMQQGAYIAGWLVGRLDQL